MILAGVLAVALASTTGVLGVVASPARAAGACRPFTEAKAVEHRDAVKRETTINDLLATLADRKDVFGLNGKHQAALQDAAGAITALDTQVQTQCFTTVAELDAAVAPLYVDYRVYWLRVPQTAVIEAADALGTARAGLGGVAKTLSPLVGNNAAAKNQLGTMNAQLAVADAKLGVAPAAAMTIATAAGLAPAKDMTANDAAINAARADLAAAAKALQQANAAGHAAIAALQG
jgi:hypothetical protein